MLRRKLQMWNTFCASDATMCGMLYEIFTTAIWRRCWWAHKSLHVDFPRHSGKHWEYGITADNCYFFIGRGMRWPWTSTYFTCPEVWLRNMYKHDLPCLFWNGEHRLGLSSMPKKYATEEARKAARLMSKRRYYILYVLSYFSSQNNYSSWRAPNNLH